MTREVASIYRVDERRIFIAGMSAGAAMAVILGAMYPELYVAVGAPSGLPYGAAPLTTCLRPLRQCKAALRSLEPISKIIEK
jgi:poly(3-hydroxybutyrate) depolymerase